jgi:hypothetical protein
MGPLIILAVYCLMGRVDSANSSRHLDRHIEQISPNSTSERIRILSRETLEETANKLDIVLHI